MFGRIENLKANSNEKTLRWTKNEKRKLNCTQGNFWTFSSPFNFQPQYKFVDRWPPFHSSTYFRCSVNFIVEIEFFRVIIWIKFIFGNVECDFSCILFSSICYKQINYQHEKSNHTKCVEKKTIIQMKKAKVKQK